MFRLPGLIATYTDVSGQSLVGILDYISITSSQFRYIPWSNQEDISSLRTYL